MNETFVDKVVRKYNKKFSADISEKQVGRGMDLAYVMSIMVMFIVLFTRC